MKEGKGRGKEKVVTIVIILLKNPPHNLFNKHESYNRNYRNLIGTIITTIHTLQSILNVFQVVN